LDFLKLFWQCGNCFVNIIMHLKTQYDDDTCSICYRFRVMIFQFIVAVSFIVGGNPEKITNLWVWVSSNVLKELQEKYQKFVILLKELPKVNGKWYIRFMPLLSQYMDAIHHIVDVGQIYTLRPIESKYCRNIVQMYVISNILK
jgi:hypothetical protein